MPQAIFLAKLINNSNDFLGELLLTMECENCIRTKEIIKQANLSPISINSLNWHLQCLWVLSNVKDPSVYYDEFIIMPDQR